MKTVVAFSFLMLVPTLVAAQLEQRYKVEAEDLAHPLAVKELNRPGRHKVKISRRFSNENEEKLMRIAEAVYPPPDEVTRGLTPDQKAEVGMNDVRLWWCREFDSVRIPYAVTRSAVAYYLEVSAEFGKKKPRVPFWRSMKSSSLTYQASIMRKESYRAGQVTHREVYIVSMMLGWSQYCGNLCAMDFGKSRTVVLSEQGEVLAVEGDGCEPILVSEESNNGMHPTPPKRASHAR
jgi:hypothetical protein